jgi:RNA polymerase sigma factor (sigma-70 family)
MAMAEQDKRITDTIAKERIRLRNFIRQRVADPGDAEDILQDVLYELVEAYRLPEPIEQVGAWLFRVARNRIIDLFRKNRPEPISTDEDDDGATLQDLLPSPHAGPEAAYARSLMLEELEAAIEALPAEQRSVFIDHELEGRSFKEISSASGVSVNTLLSRKRYAVLQLRARLQAFHDEYGQNPFTST